MYNILAKDVIGMPHTLKIFSHGLFEFIMITQKFVKFRPAIENLLCFTKLL